MNRRTLLKWSGALVVGSALGAVESLRAATPAAKGRPGPATRPARKEQLVKVSVYNEKGELVGPIEMPKVVKTDEQWRLQLTPDQFKIARAKGTERPFCGNLLDNHKDGVYTCVCCGLPLFSSDTKFQSGTGWPSFFQPVSKENVVEYVDRTHGMVRKEILCARCDCHLGHVFDDGPAPTHLRYCVNSESLKFTDKAKLATLADAAADKLTAGATTQPAKG